jgi:cell division protease FtsH
MQWLRKFDKQRTVGFSRPLIVVLLIAIGAIGVLVGRAWVPEPMLSYSELVHLPEAKSARHVLVEGERFAITFADGQKRLGIVGDPDARRAIVDKFVDNGATVEYGALEEAPGSRAVAAIAPLAVLVVLGAIGLVMHRRKARAHFAEANARSSCPPVRFNDVAGMDEVKEALTETVEFLRNPERFRRLGGRPPRGVLLTGAPGTGKTLLARAVATEAGVPFLSASGSSFQEMFVGVGASRVRSLFAEARRATSCIVFIDEIDAVGRSRGRSGDSASLDHDQTLNQLLVEMDGFDPTTGIVVIASTNRVEVLDSALLRPGRFDRQIVVPLPDLRGRREILEVHARPITLEEGIDLSQVAKVTPGFSGADLANLLNEAAITAAREGAEAVELTHIDKARDKVLMGAERKSLVLDPDERRATAIHEAGHVAVALSAKHADPVHKVSILPRGRALGVTQSLPERDRLLHTREFLEDQICVLMGGRAAEIVMLGTMTAGAADDIQRAAMLARKMVAELGMSELGPISVTDHPGMLAHGAALIGRVDEVSRKLVESQLARACSIVESMRGGVNRLTEKLLEEDTVVGDAIVGCFDG